MQKGNVTWETEDGRPHATSDYSLKEKKKDPVSVCAHLIVCQSLSSQAD